MEHKLDNGDDNALLKPAKGAFQRLHLEKITHQGRKATTVSIDNYSYLFLADKLGEKPFTRGANKVIKEWIDQKMQTDPTYDDSAPYSFSAWLKKIILFEIVDRKLKKKFDDENVFLLYR